MAKKKDLKKFRGGIRLESTTAPTDLAGDSSDAGALYFDSTAKGLKVHDGTNFTDVGAGSSGGLDTFYSEDFRAFNETTDLTQTTSNAGISIADNINGKSLVITQAASASSGTIFYTKDGGHAVVTKQKGNTCSISFWYTFNGSDDKIKVVVKSLDSLDVETTLTSSSDLLKSTSTAKKFVTTFTVPSDSAKLQWGIDITAEDNKILKIDDVEMSQDPFVQADLGTITDWETYTPVTSVTDPGSGGTKTGKWRRVGDSMEVVFEVQIGNGNPGGNHAIVGLPTSPYSGTYKGDYEIDDTKVPHKNRIIGEFYISQTEDANLHGVEGVTHVNIASADLPDVHTHDVTRKYVIIFNNGYPGFVQLSDQSVGGGGSSAIEICNWNSFGTLGPGDKIYGKFTVPIKGWGSTNTHIVTPAKSNLTDWVTYTPDATQIGANGTNDATGRYRRVGDSMEVTFELVGHGSPQSVMAVVGLPGTTTGASSVAHTYTYTPDFNKIISQGTILGHWWISQEGDADLIPRGTESHTGRSGVIIALNNADGVGHVLLSQNSFGSNTYIDANNWSEFTDLNTTDDDKIYGRFTVPIVGWSAQDSNFLAALPMTKYQKKELDSDWGSASGLTALDNQLGFSKLTVGKIYKLTLHINYDGSPAGTGDFYVTAINGDASTSEIAANIIGVVGTDEIGGGEYIVRQNASFIFKATNSVITYRTGDMQSGDFLRSADPALGLYGTSVILEELPMHEEVSIW